jgi:uncharacterized protein YajQ (UPF0234 family)
MVSDNETRMKALVDVLQSKLHKRNIDIRQLELGELEDAAREPCGRKPKLSRVLKRKRRAKW